MKSPEICHASVVKVTNRFARLSGELAIARLESLALAGLFFFQGRDIGTPA
jgi:hypothetical protein